MPGIFILSLDCEGKWGVADHLNDWHQKQLNDSRLKEAYTGITALLHTLGMSATFAFTELFTLSADELMKLPIDEIVERLPYSKAAFSNIRAGSFEGWSAPWVKDLVSARHEIACHGVTHTPWDNMNEAQACFELSLVSRRSGQTFIFPRNRISHLDILMREGFKGYRLPPADRSRLSSLVSEFDISASAEQNPLVLPLQPIPAGYFINWRSGLRKIIAPSWTRLRARRILKDAVKSNGVAHFWTHPENIASAPSTLSNLRAILEEAALLRNEGKIICMTQAQYCDYMSGLS
jgi:peptidoglycan/xylan/chitin deacetylase (PgdA/CDA1 family)